MPNSLDTERQRLVVVSNRLPFNLVKENGDLQFHKSAGGLVSGLEAYVETFKARQTPPHSYLWVGWPGSTVEDSVRHAVQQKAISQFHSLPVFLPEEEMNNFYNGFCNRTIWPLFHYFPTYAAYQEEFWRSYRRVNEIFCDTLLEVLKPDDTIWIHDYHLMLLPRLLRARGVSSPIGFFLHIPFPAFDVFRLMPLVWRREILEGILGADVIGFHTFEYSQNFLQSVMRALDHEHNLGQLFLSTHVAKVDTFPMGIDFEKFHNAMSTPEVISERKGLEESLGRARCILSVDRLDYSKGIINRLEGFEILLERHPEYHGKVVLVMVVVPSRVMVDQYELMKKQIEELVGKVNGKFGTVGWTPVVYQYRSVPFQALSALYSVSDVALVTPLRDGMNLVAKEYVACRTDGSGVLILSEMAGAVKELGEAIVINPNYREETAEALHEALAMPVEEQKRRNRIMQGRLRRYTIFRWAEEFVGQLIESRNTQAKFLAKLLPQSVKQKLVQDFKRASSRLILLDYDGTLVPFERRPTLAKPTAEVLDTVRRLTGDRKTTVVLTSGRDRDTLQNWFSGISLNMVAEHGIWIREGLSDWTFLKQQSNDWKSRVIPILQQHADRVPGSFVEEKEYSVAWHYRASDPEQSRLLVGELTDNLVNFTATIGLQVLRGNKVVEVRTAGINKGTAAMHWLSRASHDFVLAIGDDVTDEDLFAVLPESAYSIRVGIANTHARYNLRDTREVLSLLVSLPER